MPKPNALTRGKKKQAEAFLNQGRLGEAKNAYEAICRTDKADADAWLALGIVSRKLRLFDDAESACRRALALQPGNARAHRALGAAVQCKGDLASAILHYRNAIRIDSRDAETHYLLANALREAGSMADSVDAYRAAITLRPDFLEALSNLGAVLLTLGDLQGAVEVLNRAILLRPDSPHVLCNLGHVCQRDGRFDDALAYYERALRLDPDAVEALASVSALYEKTHRLAEARGLLKRGLQLASEHPLLNLTAANLARRDGNFSEATALLESLLAKNPAPDISGPAHMLLGQLYDRAGESERAFKHISEGNRLSALTSLPTPDAKKKYLDTVRHSASYLSPALAALANSPTVKEVRPSPVFLLGFARSGTTLLEQILDAHPNIQALEEKPMVQAMFNRFAHITLGRPDPLASLSGEEIDTLRNAYFDELDRHIKLKPGSILIDKMPLNTVRAHLIWRVFPDARFILAIRHPCDVCLSCLMQSFGINEAMASFFTLEDTVEVYSEVMNLWRRCLDLLPLDYRRVRYEDLVSDFATEARGLIEFLGLPWDAAVLEHTEHAKKRGTINTPSYHQVTQPIYQHAKYRWKRYASQFEPHMEALAPFIEYFGYAEDEHRNQEAPMDLSV